MRKKKCFNSWISYSKTIFFYKKFTCYRTKETFELDGTINDMVFFLEECDII